MSETTTATFEEQFKVLDGIEFRGAINTSDPELLANIQHAIRLGYPQVRAQQPHGDRALLVCSGPSLESTLDELRELYFEGAKVVTVNGAYHWCLERNIRPSAQVVLDARPSNARFLEPAVPQCRYLLASQCAPEAWAVVKGRPQVWIWHSIGPDPETEQVLTDYYQGRFQAIGFGPVGGTTVGVRAIALLRTMGFLRYDIFGMDSCYMGGMGHAMPQPENDADRRVYYTLGVPGRPETQRKFLCSPWHGKQLEDFLRMIRAKGNEFLLRVHGDGMLAYALQVNADVVDVADAPTT